jgi:leucyl aminopeptidase
MEIYVRKCALEDAAVPLLVVGFFEGEEKLPDPVLALDQATRGLLTRLLSVGDFQARHRETCLVHVPAGDRAGPERILLLGLGKRAEFSLSELRRASAQAALAARDAHLCAVAYAVPLVDSLEVEEQARTVVEAAMLALYRFDRYRTREPEDRDSIDRLTLIVTGEITEEEVGPAVSEGRILAEAANLCRDLGNTPAIDATPTYMAERAMDLAADHGLVSTIIERPEMEARGMGGILGVSRGSEQPPKLVVLSHNFDRKDLPTICLVGKGITSAAARSSRPPEAPRRSSAFPGRTNSPTRASRTARSAMERSSATRSSPWWGAEIRRWRRPRSSPNSAPSSTSFTAATSSGRRRSPRRGRSPMTR